MSQGLLIVLEGVDGAGTTTHTARLHAALRERYAVHESCEPTPGPVGALLRHALTGRLVTPGAFGARPPAWNTLALMFAADRLDHLDAEVEPLLRDGITVLCDRYYHSSVAYQSLTSGRGAETIGWIREINRYARKPDLTIVLQVPQAVAAERRRRRAGRDLFDEEALQEQLGGFYAELGKHFPDERIVNVDANAPIDRVGAAILAHAEEALGKR